MRTHDVKADRRKEFIYQGVRVTPQPPKGSLRRHWIIIGIGTATSGQWGRRMVDTKTEARIVIDAWFCQLARNKYEYWPQ